MGKINLSGPELIALASSLAIAIYDKFDKEDVRKIKCLLANISGNLTVIEIEGRHRNGCGKIK